MIKKHLFHFQESIQGIEERNTHKAKRYVAGIKYGYNRCGHQMQTVGSDAIASEGSISTLKLKREQHSLCP